tara:strand:- start:11562 stop:11837 length:276 start_codon:yes stop_codon:yes gene_type:complete
MEKKYKQEVMRRMLMEEKFAGALNIKVRDDAANNQMYVTCISDPIEVALPYEFVSSIEDLNISSLAIMFQSCNALVDAIILWRADTYRLVL